MKEFERKYLVIDKTLITTNENDKVITIEDNYEDAIRKGNNLCEYDYQVVTILVEKVEEREVDY